MKDTNVVQIAQLLFRLVTQGERRANLPSGLAWGRWFVHHQQVVESTEEKIPFLRRPSIVAHLERLVMSDHGYDVHRGEKFLHSCEQFKTDWIEALSLHIRIADVECGIPVRPENAMHLTEDLLH